MDSNFKIRPIELQDNPSVEHIIKTVMPQFGACGDGFAINDPEVMSMFEAYQDLGRSYWVIEAQNHEVIGGAGFAELKGGEKDTCELQKMYFLEAARGHGLGQKLIELCMQEAKKAGYKKMYIETMDNMKAAQGLYKKNGFSYIDQSLGSTGHHGCNTWLIKTL